MLEFITWAAIFQGLFLSILYFSSKQHQSFSNKILALFLLALIQEAINMFLPEDQIGGYILNAYFGLPESKLFLPPLFFHYILLKIRSADKYKLFLKLMYILAFAFIGLTILNISLFFISGNSLEDLLGFRLLEGIFMTQQTLACLLSIIVLIFSISELLQFRQSAETEMSDISLLQLNWLWHIIISMGIAAVLWSAEIGRILFFGGIGTSNIAFFTWFLLFLFIYYASYKAFTQKDLARINVIPKEDLNESRGKNPKKKLNDKQISQIVQKIESTMVSEKLFLNSNLSIYDLAKVCDLSSRKVSQAIKLNYGQNFSEWVNTYRIEKAKALLENFEESNLTIEGIGFDSGFNSRSAMYLAFKKITGKSPGDFKG